MKNYTFMAICILLLSKMVISANSLDKNTQTTCVSTFEETKTEHVHVDSNQPSDCDFMDYIRSFVGWLKIKKPQFTQDGILKDTVTIDQKNRCPKKYN